MKKLQQYEFWFVAGCQSLYGQETIDAVIGDAQQMAADMNESPALPCKLVYRPIVKSPQEITAVCLAANSDPNCAGLVLWMHTFSPAKMWIDGLSQLQKPMLHLHTQFNREIPWDSMDMDFMNLNQSAHGDREFGYICTRMKLRRKVIAGHWQDEDVLCRLGNWMRTAAGVAYGKSLKIARFCENMREVAVTGGDRVDAQIRLGWSINGYGIGDLVDEMNRVSQAEVDRLMAEYERRYTIASPNRAAIAYQARIELGLRAFLTAGGYDAFTTTFQVLHGMEQLPGLACQRLMEDGYGFAGEGDWKTAGLVRVTKFMAEGLPGGTSFMEDYTYHLEQGNQMVLGAHMLEVCPTLAEGPVRIEVHPLGIGDKGDPARMVFSGKAGEAVNASLVDMGTHMRLIISEVSCIQPPHALPRLPVARVMWRPKPSLTVSAEAWILAGGAHHTCLSLDIGAGQLRDWADMVGVEAVEINAGTVPAQLCQQLRWNQAVMRLGL